MIYATPRETPLLGLRFSDKGLVSWITLTATLGWLSWIVVGAAYGSALDDDEELETTARGIRYVAPDVDPARADRLAFEIVEAARESEFESLLIVGIIQRESGFARDIEELRRFGDLGERGLMQIHGVGLGYRPPDCTSRLEGARCQIRTGVRFLAAVRAHCGGSMARWVASYGMSRCAPERHAERHHTVRLARRYYFLAGGSSWGGI